MILGIETSCDETSAALIEPNDGRPLLRGLVILSQDVHRIFGGVVPELASREHVRMLDPVVQRTLAEAGVGWDRVTGVAVTAGPGLIGALLVGVMYGKGLALSLGVPLIGIHHHEGHLFAPLLEDPDLTPPFVALLVSGGHTMLLDVPAWGEYRLLGQTLDDAAGEAFDKSAKLLGLGYPGGPALAALAEHGQPKAFALPRPLLHRENLDFSFAGLKTALATLLRRQGTEISASTRADLAASTQAAIVDVLVAKTLRALEVSGLQRVVVAGGVGANRSLRAALDAGVARLGARVYYPPPALCTDNGAMIAMAAALRWRAGRVDDRLGWLGSPRRDLAFEVEPRWPLAVPGVTAEPRLDR